MSQSTGPVSPPAPILRPAVLAGLLVVGLALRLWWLPAWGTFDTEVQKAWSSRAAREGVADIYGPPDRELIRRARERAGDDSWLAVARELRVPRATFGWKGSDYFVDYPPGSVLVLWGAGHLYDAFYPGWHNWPAFNACINLAPLLGSMAIALVLLRSSRQHGPLRSLAFWLNPAVLLAAPVLGYQDTIFGAFGLLAVLQLQRRRYVQASVLTVIAGLIKPQGVLLLPTLIALTLRESPPRVWMRCALASAATGAVILAPWWLAGHLISAVEGALRPLGQVTLAPLGLNLWWIAGWLREFGTSGPWPIAEVISIDQFRAWAGWDPRGPARLALAFATAANLWLLLRRPREDRGFIALSVVLQVHSYALLATSVHENHTFLAVILLPLLIGVRPGAAAFHGTSSGFLFANLFLMAGGLGRRIMRLRHLVWLRGLSGIDLSVLVAAGHAVLVAALYLWAGRGGVGSAQEPSKAE